MRKTILLLIMFFLCSPICLAQTNRRFTGQILDRSSDLYYFNLRYYQANVGRFTQPDPLQNNLALPDLKKRTGLDLQQILANPQRLNSYSYSLNNPIVKVDPTGAIPRKMATEAQKSRFDAISNYIRNDDSFWLVRDRDGNGPAMDLLWHKALEINKQDVGKALNTMFEAVNLDWRSNATMDESREDYLDRISNLPSNLSGIWGLHINNQMDKLQHFVKSAELTYRFGSTIARGFGIAHEAMDGLKALFSISPNYFQLRGQDGGFSRSDLYANNAGILWIQSYQNNPQTNPSAIINKLY